MPIPGYIEPWLGPDNCVEKVQTALTKRQLRAYTGHGKNDIVGNQNRRNGQAVIAISEIPASVV